LTGGGLCIPLLSTIGVIAGNREKKLKLCGNLPHPTYP
jgi:hypothetical protein